MYVYVNQMYCRDRENREKREIREIRNHDILDRQRLRAALRAVGVDLDKEEAGPSHGRRGGSR